ncbi:MAG: IS21-like element helper ATPase IstB [Candidatus Paracaedibacteraceae bacterium]|nr:IS21-like element helper ATPase IstB [Candidatus Paracaedibacteraceae bacterium]
MHDFAKLPLLLKKLRLATIRNLWEPFARQAFQENWPPDRYLAILCEHEIDARLQKKLKRNLKQAQLPAGKALSTFDFSHAPTLNKAKIQDLADNTAWVNNKENLLIFGPSGVGKTHLAAAIAYGLIERGIRVLLTSTTALVQKLQAARQQLCLPQTLAKMDSYQVLILDDIGYVRKDEAETHVLFELIAHRYESGSLMVTANQPFSEWDSIFADTTMTVAAIDRLVHHATIIEIVSESYRRTPLPAQ